MKYIYLETRSHHVNTSFIIVVKVRSLALECSSMQDYVLVDRGKATKFILYHLA